MKTNARIVGLTLAIISLFVLTGCLRPLSGSQSSEGASVAATVAAAKATEAAAVQVIAQATSAMQRPIPTATTAPTQAVIRSATAAPTQSSTPVGVTAEPQGQRFYLNANSVLSLTPPPANSQSHTECLSECVQTWAITLTQPLQGNAYGYRLVSISGSYDVRLLHTRGDQQTVLAEWLNRSGWQGGPQLDALPGDVLTLEITAALGAVWRPKTLPVAAGSLLAYDYGSYSYVIVGTTPMPLPTFPAPPRPTPVVLDSSSAVQIRYGDMITQTVKSPGDVGIYAFDGKTGDVAFIVAAGTADALWLELQVKLYNPQGKPMTAESEGRGEYKLGTDGRYVFTVRNANTRIGPYNVLLKNARPGAGAKLAYGAFIENRITVPGDTHIYSFTGKASDVIRIVISCEREAGSWLGVNFLDPERQSLGGGTDFMRSDPIIIEKPLPANGEYTVEVYAYATGAQSTFTQPANYTLSVVNVTSARLTYGDVVTGTIVPEGDKDVYVFEGKAGEKPMIEARRGHGLGTDTASDFAPQIEIFDSKGNSLAQGSTGAESVIQLKLALYNDDTYMIAVERNPYWGVSTGDYTLILKDLAAP